MSSVRPLVFLTLRTVVNGVRRAVTSPKRIIGLAFFCLYYWNLFLRPFSPSRPPTVALPPGTPHLALPPAGTVDGIVFGLVGLMSIFLMANVLNYKGGFRSADVDVLFPTPVSPRVVLFFRIARDVLGTLILPLFVALIGFRSVSPLFGSFFQNYPKTGGDILRGGFFAYLFASFTWVCIGYAASMFVNRSDLRSDRNAKTINYGVATVVLLLLVYVAVRLRADLSVATALAIAHDPLVRIVLAPVTLATWVAMGTFEGQLGFVAMGLAGLALLIGLALRVALTQVGWMYDQAAVRGFESGPNLRELQRKGDLVGIQAARARQGKIRQGRIARWIARQRVRGPLALVWKESILQARGSLSGLLLLGTVFLVMTGFTMWTVSSASHLGRTRPVGASLGGWTLLGMQGLMVYVLCMASAQGGFIEFLRRVDLQKPLPFTPSRTVFWEVVAKAIAPTALSLLSAVVGVAMLPSVWPFALAGVVVSPSLAVLVIAVALLVTVLFPDLEDPTQRMFRGLMLMLGIVVCGVSGLGALVLGVGVLGLSPLLVAPVVVAINLGIAVGLSTASGGLYANYNPSE